MIFLRLLVIYNDSGEKNIITWNAHVTIFAWMLVIYNDSGKHNFITWTGHVMESGFVRVNYNERARSIDDMNQAFWKNAGEVPAPGLLLPGWMGLRRVRPRWRPCLGNLYLLISHRKSF